MFIGIFTIQLSPMLMKFTFRNTQDSSVSVRCVLLFKNVLEEETNLIKLLFHFDQKALSKKYILTTSAELALNVVLDL